MSWRRSDSVPESDCAQQHVDGPETRGDTLQNPLFGWPETFERNAPYAHTPDNRPVPLDRGLLALTREAGWQMSFGERAAFEGLLAQVKPRVAIEIGTAEGGSLKRLAAYCERVYSIDIDHAPVADWTLDNVELRTGSSVDLLTPLLSELAAAGESVDFALVDGDHSYEGAKRDLESLLASPSTSRSVILVHDTMNPEVRAGVEGVGLDRYPQVVYYEMDFVPGYVYRKGAARGTAWGGLGLVLTDLSRAEPYADAPRQDLYYEPFRAVNSLRVEPS